MNIFLIFSFIILLCYLFVIIRYSFGWNKLKTISKVSCFPNVSIIIPVRDEESNINNLVRDLEAQTYPKEKLEIIFVNDHSNDNSINELLNHKMHNLRILNLSKNEFGKKKAISLGVHNASGDIILATDADCCLLPNWAESMVSYFSSDNVKLVSGPVVFKRKHGFLHAFQELDFISLISSGAGAIGSKNPIFCNGANMAYRRQVFLDINNFSVDHRASGDDVFLLHSIKKNYSNSIVFAKNHNAIVTTSGANEMREFLHQRIRWTAKSKSYDDLTTVYVSIIVFLTSLCFTSLFVSGLLNFYYLYWFFLFYIFKFIVDSSLLLPALKFFKRKYLIKWIFIFQLIYSFYIILIVILSFTRRFEWKGRTHKQ